MSSALVKFIKIAINEGLKVLLTTVSLLSPASIKDISDKTFSL
jgi:hypothetical protein